MPGSLFGHLALRFGAHPENLATEALEYVLSSSSEARAAVEDALRVMAPAIGGGFQYRTQVVGADGAIPDLVGFDHDGRPCLIVEAKFWAGLTDRQPVEYLRRLPSDCSAVLLFVAPSLRFVTLWAELVRRCTDADVTLGEERSAAGDLVWTQVDSHHTIALISWRALLATMHSRVSAGGDVRTAHEIDQLDGLCERMDVEAFAPLQSEELFTPSPRRLAQFVQILDAIATTLVARGLASRKNLRKVGGGGWYGHYRSLPRANVFIYMSFEHWAGLRETPLWLWVKDRNWRATPALREQLRPLELEVPSRLLEHPSQGCPLIPLFLPVGVERDEVVQAVVDQILSVHALLSPTLGDEDAVGGDHASPPSALR